MLSENTHEAESLLKCAEGYDSARQVVEGMGSQSDITGKMAKGESEQDADPVQDGFGSVAEQAPLLESSQPGFQSQADLPAGPSISTDGFVSIRLTEAAPEPFAISGSQHVVACGGSLQPGLLHRAWAVLCQARRAFWESGTAVMLVAALIMAIGALSVAFIDGRVPVFQIVMIRSVGSLLLTMPFVKADSWRAYMGTRSLWPLLALRGFTGAASMTFYYESIDRMPLADAITIMYSNPVVVALLAWAFRGELLSLQGSIGTAITLLGVVIVAQPPFLFGGDDWTGTRMAGFVMGVLAAVFAAVAFFVISCIPKSEPALVLSLWFHGASIAMSVVPLMVGYPDEAVVPSSFDWCLLCVIITASFFGQMLLNHGFQIQSTAKASSINCTQVMHAHIFGVTLLDERESVWGILGSLLIASGVVTVNGAKGQPESAGSEHDAGLPVFQGRAAEGNAAGRPPKPGKLPAASEAEPRGGSAIFGASATWREPVARLFRLVGSGQWAAVLGSSPGQQGGPQQVQLPAVSAVAPAADPERAVLIPRQSQDTASAFDNAGAARPCGSPTSGLASVPELEQEGAELSSSLGDAGRAIIGRGREGGGVLGRARTREPAGRHPGEAGSLRDAEKSWAGEWAFRRATESGGLAPAMARYHQLLEGEKE